MNIICVDDERLVLDLTVGVCKEILAGNGEVHGFWRSKDALDWVSGHFADIALLDIDMPDMNGMVLAARIKEKSPDTAIIFLTGYDQYAVEAFSMHVSGYLLKPVSKERLLEEFAYALDGAHVKPAAHVTVKTFGNFDVFVDGKPVPFSRAKSKEFLAYLVDRQGSNVTRAEAFAALWEDANYDRSMQKQLDVIVRSLRTTLEDNGIGNILEMKSGFIRVVPELIDCDLYRFMNGDIEAINAYRGEYMIAYPWAELTEAYMDRLQRKRLE